MTLTTLAQGRFSDNAFLLHGDSAAEVAFIAWGELDLALLRKSLRVESLSDYVSA